MKLIVNGADHDHRGTGTVAALLAECRADPEQSAVMLNDVIVCRSALNKTCLKPGDCVEIVTLMGGGSPRTIVAGADRRDALPVRSTEKLILGPREFTSRLLLGTGKFADRATMLRAIEASGAQLVTVALRRFNREQPADDLYGPLARLNVTLMPNTSGARDAAEAVKAARLGRELSHSPFVKVEIHPNPHHLLPDPIETFEACKRLIAEGFVVLPYIPADPVLAKRLEEIGCAAVMPLGSAIGTGRGLATVDMLRYIVRDCTVPVIVDAGLRSPADAAAAMELGCDAVLVNSAIAAAAHPVAMATAFAQAVRAGHAGRLAGLMSSGDQAVATSPLTAFLSGRRDESPASLVRNPASGEDEGRNP